MGETSREVYVLLKKLPSNYVCMYSGFQVVEGRPLVKLSRSAWRTFVGCTAGAIVRSFKQFDKFN